MAAAKSAREILLTLPSTEKSHDRAETPQVLAQPNKVTLLAMVAKDEERRYTALGPNENKISHRSWERGWLELIICQSSKVRPYAVERLAASSG